MVGNFFLNYSTEFLLGAEPTSLTSSLFAVSVFYSIIWCWYK